MLLMRSGKRQITEEIDLINQEKIRMIGGKKTYEYSGILETDIMKQVEMKEKN